MTIQTDASIEHVFKIVVNYAILLTELAGVSILIATACKSFIDWVRKDPHVRLKLAQGIAIALDFKLGSALTVLIHWQIVKEEQRLVE